MAQNLFSRSGAEGWGAAGSEGANAASFCLWDGQLCLCDDPVLVPDLLHPAVPHFVQAFVISLARVCFSSGTL